MPISFVFFGIILILILFTDLFKFRSVLSKWVILLFLFFSEVGYLNFNYYYNVDFSVNTIHLFSTIFIFIYALILFKFNLFDLMYLILTVLVFILFCNSYVFNLNVYLMLLSFVCVFSVTIYSILGKLNVFCLFIINCVLCYIVMLTFEYIELDFVVINFDNLYLNFCFCYLIYLSMDSFRKLTSKNVFYGGVYVQKNMYDCFSNFVCSYNK